MKKKFWIILTAVLLLAAVIAVALLLPKDSEDNPGTGSQPDDQSKTLIFLPDTVTVYRNEKLTGKFTLDYEEGWQTKDSFTATYIPSEDTTENDIPVITYSDKFTETKYNEKYYEEATYDEKGNIVAVDEIYIDNGMLEKVEIKNNYDKYGRLTGLMQITIFRGDPNAGVQSQSYAYTYIEVGSQASFSKDGRTYIRTYDKNFRLIWEEIRTIIGEIHRTDYTYDEYGNLLSSVKYYNGAKEREMIYTYKAVETTDEVIARWVQFNSNQ